VSVYLRLRVASETYAIPVEHVVEVADLGLVRAVPGARPELLGVRNVRGHILPVADLALLLGIRRTTPPQRLLVAEVAGQRACFAVDEVTEVGEMSAPAEETDSDLLAGAALAGGDLVGIIDVPKTFRALERATP
jgi:purine-binding chemotaxis protein CheW